MNKRITSILLAVLMVMSTLVTAVPTNAAGGAPNVAFEIDAASEINPGDTFTVTLRNVGMAVNSFACGIAFDAEKLEWVSTVSGTDIGTEDYDPDYYGLKKVKGSNKNGWYTELTTSSAAEIAANEAVGFTAGAGSTDIEYYEGIIAIITFKAKDVAGEAELTIYESSASDDTVNGDGYNGKDGFETKKVTITAAHVCAPVIVEAKAATCEDDGNIAYYECDCGKYYEDAEATKEITDKTSVVVPAFDHDWDDGVVTTDPTETDAGVKTYTCQNDNSHTKTEEVPALGHQCNLHLTLVAAKDATCEDDGNIAYYECDCGKYYEDAEATKEITDKTSVVVPAFDHDWDDGVVTTDPTETDAGVKTYTCQNDNSHTKTEEVPALGHQCNLHLTLVAAKDATCEDDGNIAYYECDCGKYYEDAEATKEITDKTSVVVPAFDHDWDDGVVTTDPTETDAGVKTYTCQNDNSHTKTEEVPALGHQCNLHLTLVAAKDATCEDDGNIAYYECDCGKYYEDAEATKEITDKTSVVVPAFDHDWDDGVVTTDPTETDAGVKTYTCQNDNSHTKTEEVPALGHQCNLHLTLVAAKDATCEDDGNIAYYECDCGKYYEDAEATKEITDKTSVVVPAFDHDWDDGVVTTDPTETDKGVKTYTCQNDNSHTKTEEVPALGHQCNLHLTLVAAKDATCEDDGNIAYYECDCGKYYEDAEATKEITDKTSVVVPAFDHDWDDGVVTTDPTETDAGVKTYTCQNDNSHTKTEEVPALGHQCNLHLTLVAAKDATCEDDGNIAYYECDCGKYYEDADATKEITDKTSVVVPAFDHDWDDGVVTTDPTETDAGVKTYTCQNDNSHTYTEEVPALGHQCSLHLTPVDAEDATCEDDGNIAHYVCDCGKLYKDTDATKELTTKDVVIKAGHEWGKWVVTVEATTEAAGEERRDCSECDEYETREIPKLEDNKFWDTWYWTMMMIYNQIFEIEADATEGGEIDPYGITKVRFSRDVKYTITPAEGYEIEAVYVDGKDIGAVDSYTFKNVSKDHSIYAVFAKIEKEPIYTDIDTDDWFYDDVVYVTENGLMNGTGNGKFSPYVSTTRAMIVTILWRLEGEVSAKSAGFTDVADGMWYTEAIDWAAANGIVNGYGDGTFGPEKNITREQIMAIFHRYAAYKGWDDGVAVSMIAQYDCSVWAENDVNWADMNGILAGLGVDINDMTAEADRAEIAAYFTRFCLNVAK